MKQKNISVILIVFSVLFALEINAQYTDFEHDGGTRQYIYYEPENLNQQMPLVFVMHGYTGDANSIRNYSDMNDFADMNSVYAEFFGEDTAPARSTVQVAGLPLAADMEIEALASLE